MNHIYLKRPLAAQNFFQEVFFNYALILWNELLNDIRSIDTITTFKTALKTTVILAEFRPKRKVKVLPFQNLKMQASICQNY